MDSLWTFFLDKAVKNNGDGNTCLNRKKSRKLQIWQVKSSVNDQKQNPAKVQGKWE